VTSIDASSPRRLRDWPSLEKRLLVAGLALAVVVRVICRQGVGYLDSQNYVNASLDILDRGVGNVLGWHQIDRLGVTVPPALLMAVFGRTETVAVLYFFALALVEMALVPVLLARRFAPRTVVVATLLYAFAPMTIRDSTTNGADLAMTAFANVSVLLLLVAPRETRLRWCAAAGVVLGIAEYHKETAVVLLPVAAAAAFFAERDGFAAGVKRVLAFGVGFAVPIAVEMSAYAAWTGSPIYRYTHIEPVHVPSLASMEQSSLAARFLVYWPAAMLASPQTFGVLIFLLPAVVLAHALDRFRVCGPLVALWLLFPGLYTVFGTSTLSAWHPLLPFPRYLHFVLLPLAVLAAQLVVGEGALLGTTMRRVDAVCATASLFVVACVFKFRDVDGVVAGATAVVLVLLACRATPPRLAFVVATLCAIPVETAAERIAGRAAEAWAPERRALADLRARGVHEIRSRSPQLWALQVMTRLGELPDFTVLPMAPDEAAAAPRGAVVLYPLAEGEKLVAERDASGAPIYDATATYPAARFPRDAGVLVLVRR